MSRESAIMLAVLISTSVFLTIYTASAQYVALSVYESDGRIFWRSTPGGPFFPWPKQPGWLMLLSEMNQIDSLIYLYLIKSWMLVSVTLLLWAAVSWKIWKLVCRRERSLSEG